MNPLNNLPVEFQNDMGATLLRFVSPTAKGHFYLTGARYSGERDFQSQRITVIVLDENGFPLPFVRVAYSFSTADQFIVTDDFLWMPPAFPAYGNRAFIIPTQGSGQCDMVLGPEGVVKAGSIGGVTVFCFQPEYSSDVITGLGMLATHRAPILTFQLQRYGVKPLAERLDDLETRVKALEAKDVQLIGQ